MPPVSLRTFLHIRYWYAWPVMASMLVMSLLPGRILWIFGRGLGSLFYWFPSPSRRFAERNIELCFPNLDPAARRKLVRESFRLLGFAVMSLSVAWWAPKWRLKQFVTIRDAHFLEEAIASRKNVILFAPHFIGLDMVGVRVSADRKYVTMYRESRA